MHWEITPNVSLLRAFFETADKAVGDFANGAEVVFRHAINT